MLSNKQVVESFLTLVASGKVQEWFDLYIDKDFIHHNQYFPGDRQSLLDAMQQAHEEHPNRAFTIKKMLAEGDTVVAYSLVKKELMDIVVMHMCQCKDGKIIEMRDVGTVIDPESPNEYGLF